MHWIDWTIIGAYVVFVTGIGLAFIKRASGGVAEYFVAGRNLPWWLAGTSLIATSFAADTPLFVTGLVATKGIAGNWLWWNQVVAWALAMVFFARLWRRSGVVTDAEFIELRYGGRSGAFLRGFRAVYMSFVVSTCTLAWVMLAMQKIVAATMAKPAWVDGLQSAMATAGWSVASDDLWKGIVLLSLFGVATLYTVLSGFWGIVVTDLVQFIIAIVASVLFAIFAVDSVGGMAGLKTRLLEEFGAGRTSNLLSFLPEADSKWMPITAFAVYLGVLWWGDCNGFAAQRLFSTRSERDSVLSSVWYSIAHFALRPWPWVVVALVVLVHYPELPHSGKAELAESGYPRLLMDILPTGLRGLMIASLLAAFMSTVDTHLNWNASYFVTDVYRRFLAPGASEARCVRMSRLSAVGFAALAIVVSYCMQSIEGAVVFLFNLTAGLGLVLMLRWFWWRINAWSEISAMIASLVVTAAVHQFTSWPAPLRIIATAGFCAVIWVIVTLVTSPVDSERLAAFYRKVRPAPRFWGPVARMCPDVQSEWGGARTIFLWLLGAGALYAAMFTIGKLVLHEWRDGGLALLALAVFCCLLWWISRSPKNQPAST